MAKDSGKVGDHDIAAPFVGPNREGEYWARMPMLMVVEIVVAPTYLCPAPAPVAVRSPAAAKLPGLASGPA